jgi:NAD(P)-dependent dehydrogenase (short-subunit alcohol dehydrogenase family)
MGRKTVFVTGASTGIGRECALLLASKGWEVFASVRTRQAAEDLERDARGRVATVLLDITDAAALRDAVTVVSSRVGGSGLGGLVNNAGITVAGPLELLPLEALRRQFEVNVVGQIAVTQAFLPMLRAARGRIVVMGSIFGRFSVPFLGPYAGTKFALEGLAESLSMELADFGVPVSVIEPGNVMTPIWGKSKDAALAAAGDGAQEPYRSSTGAFMKFTDACAGKGISAERVAAAVLKALTARVPRTRYTVGWDSRLLGRIAPLLPGRLRRWIIRRVVLRR